MKLRTNAKVNLFLRVLGERGDGYHEIETILHSVGLSDTLEISATRSGEVAVEMTYAEGLQGEIPKPQENFVHLAAMALLEAGAKNSGVMIRLVKRIPAGAGLGGGSGNAAGALVALAQHWGLDIEAQELLRRAALIGSDVPYCIEGGTALASGRGEKLTRLAAPLSMHVVLGMADRPLPTRDVYGALSDNRSDKTGKSAPMALALGAGDVGEVAALLHNDLEAPAFALRPELPAQKESLLEAGALGALLSGSGPTLYGIARDEAHARAIAAAVEDDFASVEVAGSRPACVEIFAPENRGVAASLP
ncbi:MAG: 4-(cytidine 5'-diphospho)-2-C-methyl-D-erythritol kinase [Actinomycetota bacterium]